MILEIKEHYVKIGEVKTGKDPMILKATLGSCVGIALLWKSKGLYGLAHCLLPESPLPSNSIGAKYVSQAVPSLIAMMRIRPEDVSEIEVVVAGGGNMMAQLSRVNSDHIGSQNTKAALKYLAAHGLKIKKIDVGGEEGTQIVVDCSTGAVSVLKLPKFEVSI